MKQFHPLVHTCTVGLLVSTFVNSVMVMLSRGRGNTMVGMGHDMAIDDGE